LTSLVHRGLKPSTLKQNVRGVSPLRRERSEAYTAPLRAIGQGGAHPKTLFPYLIAAVCGLTWAATPFGEAWRLSKGEQYQSRGSGAGARLALSISTPTWEGLATK
jgi:hypothetical protein